MKNFLNLGALLTVLFVGYMWIENTDKVEAQNQCPSLAPYLCNNGSCTNDPSLCDQSWGGGISSNNPPLPPETTSTSSSTSSSIVGGTTCTGNLRYDITATQECAQIAEAQGRALGYDITCGVQTRNEFIVVDANPVGSQNTYYGSCTINGQTGFSPETLAGYTGSGTPYSDPSGLVQSQIYGAGFNINPMWYTVPSILSTGSGAPGSVTTISTTGSTGASSLINNLSINSGTTNISSNTLVRSITTTNSPGRITSQHMSGILSSVNNLVAAAKRLYGITVNVPTTLNTILGVGVFGIPGSTPSGSTTGTGSTGTGGTTGAGGTTGGINYGVVTYGPGETLSNARYVRIEATENGWISWREIEIYDSNGTKLSPTSLQATAGITYGLVSSSVSPDKAFDGNPETAWNAGETNGACITATFGCVQTVRNAFIDIDLGSAKNISKIKLMENGGTWTEVAKVYVSSDRSKFTQVAQFSFPIRDREWLEYPYPTQTGSPVVDFTVNGSSSATVNTKPIGSSVNFAWNISNADQITWTESLTGLTPECMSSSPKNINPFTYGYGYSTSLGITEDQPPFSGSKSVVVSGDACQIGLHTITVTAKQRYSGVETSKTVTVQLNHQ